jgi:hypothetical protein
MQKKLLLLLILAFLAFAAPAQAQETGTYSSIISVSNFTITSPDDPHHPTRDLKFTGTIEQVSCAPDTGLDPDDPTAERPMPDNCPAVGDSVTIKGRCWRSDGTPAKPGAPAFPDCEKLSSAQRLKAGGYLPYHGMNDAVAESLDVASGEGLKPQSVDDQ